MLSILPLLFTKISLLPQIKKQNTKHPPFSNSHCFCLARRTLHYLIVNPKHKTPGTSTTLLHIEYYHIFLVFPFFFFFILQMLVSKQWVYFSTLIFLRKDATNACKESQSIIIFNIIQQTLYIKFYITQAPSFPVFQYQIALL